MNEFDQDQASLYVLDQLERGERAAFEARMQREPALAAVVDELAAALEHGVRTLPIQTPPPSVLERIEREINVLEAGTASANVRLARPASSNTHAAEVPPPSRGFSWAPFAGWGLAAVIALSLGTLAVQSLRQPPPPTIVVVGLDGGHHTLSEIPLTDGGRDPDARFLRLASLATTYWAKPAEVPARAPRAPGQNRAYAIFDPGSRQGFIAIEELPPLAENERYHLWVADADSGRVHDAGVLPLGRMQRGLYSFALDAATETAARQPRFFVTVEDLEGASNDAQPRGKVVLGAQPL